MEAIILLQIWFGGEALLVPMPDRQACIEAIAEYPAGMATCWPPTFEGRVIIRSLQELRVKDDTCRPCVERGFGYDWQRPW